MWTFFLGRNEKGMNFFPAESLFLNTHFYPHPFHLPPDQLSKPSPGEVIMSRCAAGQGQSFPREFLCDSWQALSGHGQWEDGSETQASVDSEA